MKTRSTEKPILQTVYLVTRGEYSDYTVCAVFSENALAEKYIDSFKGNSYEEFRIEHYTLNPHSYELKNEYKPFCVRMSKDGNYKEVSVNGSTCFFTGEDFHVSFDIHNNMYISIFAKDENHAIKIANEKRVQLIATNRWK